MSKRYTQVPISYLEPIFEQWRAIYDRGNFLNIFFMPYGDILFRAMQFVDWMEDKYGEKVRIVNFETELIVNPENLEAVLKESKSSEKLILLAKRVFMRPDGVAMAAVLEKWYAERGIGALVLHEGFPVEMLQYVPKPVMMQQQMVHALYPESVAKEYAIVTADLFGVNPSTLQIDQIIAYCGGVPWLINDVLRRINSSNLFSDEALEWKVEQIARSIPNLLDIDKDLVSYGLKNTKGEWLPIFADYFDHQAKSSMALSPDEIVCDGRDLSHIFSAGERRILAYLSSAEGVVKREELGRQFWQDTTESEYSDWALDAIMSRLRKKIKKLNLPLTIKTRRGQGYECT